VIGTSLVGSISVSWFHRDMQSSN